MIIFLVGIIKGFKKTRKSETDRQSAFRGVFIDGASQWVLFVY